MTNAGKPPPSLALKWGTLKGWNGAEKGTQFLAALVRYHAEPTSLGTMSQRDTDTQQQALLDAIDAVYAAGGQAYNDWDGTTYPNADEAKSYVTNYRRPK